MSNSNYQNFSQGFSQNFSYTASSSFSSMSSSNGQTRSYSEMRHTDPSGTQVHRMSQEPGQARRQESIRYDASGKKIESGIGEERGRIEDVTDREDAAERERKAAEREYEEKMEGEYAKREGGA